MTPTTERAQRPPSPSSAHKRTAYLAWLTVCLLWGTTYLGIRIASRPFHLRCSVAFGSPWPAPADRPARRARRTVIATHSVARLALIGFLTVCVGNGGVIWASSGSERHRRP